jgi:hypothetical protein
MLNDMTDENLDRVDEVIFDVDATLEVRTRPHPFPFAMHPEPRAWLPRADEPQALTVSSACLCFCGL